MAEPLLNGEHLQTFAVDALQYFAQQLACPRFGQRPAPCFVACLLQRARHLHCFALSGQPRRFLDPSTERVDAGISPVPHHYMIGCLYPTHAETALQALRASQRDLVKRVRGLKANTSPLSPEELDKLNHLAATDVQTWVRDELACAREFDFTILGRLLRNRRTLHRRFGQGGG